MTEPRPLLLFTDLDNTLLDARYRPDAALEALGRLQRAGVPIVFCSSKTRAEQRPLRAHLGVAGPFIVENGAAIVDSAAEGTPPLDPDAPYPPRREGGWWLTPLGVDVEAVRRALRTARDAGGVRFRMFSEIPDDELARITGLDPAGAARAKAREFSETVVGLRGAPPEARARLAALLAERGIRLVSGGRFHTASDARSDKGAAVRRVVARWLADRPDTLVAAVGDSANDRPMLAAAERAFLVERPEGGWSDLGGDAEDLAHLERVEGIGPHGWTRMAEALLEGWEVPSGSQG